MIDIKVELETIQVKLNVIVSNIINKNTSNFYRKSFNIKDLPDHKNYSIHPNMVDSLRCFFKDLDKKENHCLYWFELESNEKALALNNLLNNYRLKNKGKQGYRTVPATNKYEDSNVLYVGIRRGGKTRKGLTNIVGRINQHLGYYHIASTQGLQLIHFAKGLDFEVFLNVVEFEGIENPMYLNVLEKLVALELEPLCGRH